MIEDLAVRVLAAIEEVEWVARRARSAPWVAERPRFLDERVSVHGDGVPVAFAWADNAEHIALNDPPTVLRHCEADRRTVQRHVTNGLTCRHCSRLWPCPDLLDRAMAYGITTEET